MAMQSGVSNKNVVEQTICPVKLTSKDDKKYKKNTLRDIAKAINGLFNSDGGELVLRYYTSPSRDQVKICKRKIENMIAEHVGTVTLAFDVNIVNMPGNGVIKILVGTSTKTNNLVIMKWNIFYPNAEQIVEVPPDESVEKFKLILNAKKNHSVKATEPGLHETIFVESEPVNFSESATVQFMRLQNKREKRTTFTSRLIGNSIKFPSCVSAFANYAGGYVYIGINDDGKVEGQCVDDKEKKKTVEEIRKVIKKMIWPKGWLPKDGTEEKRWDVYFVPVRDIHGNEISSLSVVVVFVAQCPGGVFTEAPECYKIVNNDVKKVNLAAFMKSINPRLTADEGY